MSAPDQETENGGPAFLQEVEEGKVTIFPADVSDAQLKTTWITADLDDSVSVGGMR